MQEKFPFSNDLKTSNLGKRLHHLLRVQARFSITENHVSYGQNSTILSKLKSQIQSRKRPSKSHQPTWPTRTNKKMSFCQLAFRLIFFCFLSDFRPTRIHLAGSLDIPTFFFSRGRTFFSPPRRTKQQF